MKIGNQAKELMQRLVHLQAEGVNYANRRLKFSQSSNLYLVEHLKEVFGITSSSMIG